MTNQRYRQLSDSNYVLLTQEEIQEGWHFCHDWDAMLVGPGMDALDSCTCYLSFPPGEKNV